MGARVFDGFGWRRIFLRHRPESDLAIYPRLPISGRYEVRSNPRSSPLMIPYQACSSCRYSSIKSGSSVDATGVFSPVHIPSRAAVAVS